jgi:hypothetical protein
MLAFVRDPRFVTYLICALNAANALRWLIEGKPAQAGYWACAFGINFFVLVGFQR